jgi:hypothetical protein
MENWDGLYDAPNILEPFHRLGYLYSMPHNQLPKNVDPNTFSSMMEILAVNDENYVLSISSPIHSYSKMVDIQREYGHGLYLRLLSKLSHSLNYKSGLSNPDNVFEYLPVIHDNDISSPKQCAHLSDLHYENYFDTLTWSKGTKFIETKVTAIKLQGFNR